MANGSNNLIVVTVAIIAIVILAFFAFRMLPQRDDDTGVLPDVNVNVNDTTPQY